MSHSKPLPALVSDDELTESTDSDSYDSDSSSSSDEELPQLPAGFLEENTEAYPNKFFTFKGKIFFPYGSERFKLFPLSAINLEKKNQNICIIKNCRLTWVNFSSYIEHCPDLISMAKLGWILTRHPDMSAIFHISHLLKGYLSRNLSLQQLSEIKVLELACKDTHLYGMYPTGESLSEIETKLSSLHLPFTLIESLTLCLRLSSHLTRRHFLKGKIILPKTYNPRKRRNLVFPLSPQVVLAFISIKEVVDEQFKANKRAIMEEISSQSKARAPPTSPASPKAGGSNSQ